MFFVSQQLVVAASMTSLSGRAIRQRKSRCPENEEFHKVLTVLKHISDLNGVIEVVLTFCSPV